MTPSEPAPGRRSFRFGPFVADIRRRLLWSDDALVTLTPKAFDILAVLLDHAGEVVEKEDLVARVWGNTAVEDATLARHISTLRRALHERPNEHRYIVTVPGHGYEFVAEVVSADHVPDNLRHKVDSGQFAVLPATHAAAAPGPAATSSASTSVPPRRISWVTLTASATLLIAVTGAVLAALSFRPTPHREAPTLRQLTYHGGFQREPQWSPDGTAIAYTSDESGNSDIWIQRTTESQPIRIAASKSEDSQPSWSPDGQALVFRSERDGGGLFVVNVADQTERRLTSFGYHPKWSPNGSQVLFSSSNREGSAARYYLVPAAGGTPYVLRPDLLSDIGASFAAWRPDGAAVSLLSRARGTRTFVTVPITGGAAIASSRSPEMDREIARIGLSLERFAWSRSGRAIYFEGTSERVRNLWRITVDPMTLAWTGGPDRLTTSAGHDSDVAISPDEGRLAFSTRVTTTRLWAFPFDASAGRILGEGKPVTSGGGEEQDAEALRDGSKLVYSAVRGGRQELWERSLPDRRDRLMLASTGWLSRPHWSPDGSRVVYAKRRNDASMNDAVVAVLTVKDGLEHLFTKAGGPGFVPSDWSPDGMQVIGGCPQGSDRPVAICVLDVETSTATAPEVRRIATDPTHNLFEQRFSPDQRWVSFMAVDRGDSALATIYVMPAAGGAWRAITDGKAYDDKPHWSPDGRTIYFASDRGGLWNVWGRRFDPVAGIAVGDPFRVTTFDSPRQTLATQLSRMQFAISADHLFLPITETSGELWMLENVDR